MLRIEFHCHTIFSKDSLLRPESLLAAFRRKDLDRLVVTDHNTILGALAAQAIEPERVIIGEEIMTQEGELLAAFIQEEVPPGLPAEEAIRRLRSQGAFISVSHPFDRTRNGSWQPSALLEITPLVDAIETFNSRCLSPGFNHLAQEFAQLHNLPATVGSDAHTAFELGRATMLLPEFHDAASLKAVLPAARFSLRLSSPLVHFSSRYAVWYKRVFGTGKFTLENTVSSRGEANNLDG